MDRSHAKEPSSSHPTQNQKHIEDVMKSEMHGLPFRPSRKAFVLSNHHLFHAIAAHHMTSQWQLCSLLVATI